MAGREATAIHPEAHARTRPMQVKRIVRSLEELALLPRERAVNGLVRRSALELAIPGLPIHAQLYAQQRLNALQRRCGCVAGSIATIAGLFAGGLRIAGRDAPAWSLATLGLCVLCVIVSTRGLDLTPRANGLASIFFWIFSGLNSSSGIGPMMPK